MCPLSYCSLNVRSLIADREIKAQESWRDADTKNETCRDDQTSADMSAENNIIHERFFSAPDSPHDLF